MRRLPGISRLFVERGGLLVVLAAAEHLCRPCQLTDPLIGLRRLAMGPTMLIATRGVEIVIRFFVYLGGAEGIAPQQELHRGFVLLVLFVE